MSGESDTEILIEKSDEFVPADEDIYEAIGTPRTSLKVNLVFCSICYFRVFFVMNFDKYDKAHVAYYFR